MRRPKKTVTINLADYLSAGTYNVKVKSKGTDIRDSADSNSVECVVAASGYSVRFYCWNGEGETVYVQINDDPTWYYLQVSISGQGFVSTNIPNAYVITENASYGISNVAKIRIGTGGNPAYQTGPQYMSDSSTGDFTNLTFTSTGGYAPAYSTSEITMTQDSEICFDGNF